jgi:hypothetical protein
LAATSTLLRATTSAPASTAATTTIAVAIPSLMTGALLIIGTSVQFLSPGAIESSRESRGCLCDTSRISFYG